MTVNTELVERVGRVDVLGLMRIKNESEWIRQSIESQVGVCNKILILDDHSEDNTRDLVRLYPERCVLAESSFKGVNEGRDKRMLLEHAIAIDPQWVVWIDGDEVLDRRAPIIFAYEMNNPEVASYALQVCYFWNFLDHIRVDGWYENFARLSAFRVRGQPTDQLRFASTGGEADLHCGGNCPQGLQGLSLRSGVRIKHYGYVHAAERQRKFEFYNRIDPNNEAEDCYRHIIETPGARHAPGPTRLELWDE